MPTAYKIALRKSGVSYIRGVSYTSELYHRGMSVKRGKEREHNHTEKASSVHVMEMD